MRPRFFELPKNQASTFQPLFPIFAPKFKVTRFSEMSIDRGESKIEELICEKVNASRLCGAFHVNILKQN